MGVVAFLGLVLQVRDGDGDAALALFGGFVNLVKGRVIGQFGRGQHFGDGRRQGRFAVVDMPDRAHVHMRLGSLKLLLSHVCSSSKQCSVQTYVRQGLHPCYGTLLVCCSTCIHPQGWMQRERDSMLGRPLP